VATAVKLAARRRRGVHVVVLITVPNHLPIDAVLPEQQRTAEQTIEAARVLGGRRVTGHIEKVRPGQGGRRLVEEAREIKARALIMALPRRPRVSGSPFGRTLETVLADRPCRVIITTEPQKTAAEVLAATS
jgi:APA family basic amino acid/polyamine antiporter